MVGVLENFKHFVMDLWISWEPWALRATSSEENATQVTC